MKKTQPLKKFSTVLKRNIIIDLPITVSTTTLEILEKKKEQH